MANRFALVIASALSTATGLANAQSAAPESGSSSAPPSDAINAIAPIAIAPSPDVPPPALPVAPHPLVRVEIVSPSIAQTLSITPPRRSSLGVPSIIARCETPCTLALEPAPYRFDSQLADGVRGSGHFDTSNGPVRLVLRRPRSSAAPILAIAGGALAFVTGLTMAIIGAAAPCFLATCPHVDMQPLIVGGISLIAVGGVVGGVGGWGIWRTRAMVDRVEPLDAEIPAIRVLPPVAPASSAPPPAAAPVSQQRELRMAPM